MHWHAFAYSGAYPPDSDARNPDAAVRPLTLADWFAKPASMRRGVFTTPDTAHDWLAAELRGCHSDPDRLDDTLARHRKHLVLGQDAYAAGYTRGGGIYVRALLTCPRTGADQRPVPCTQED